MSGKETQESKEEKEEPLSDLEDDVERNDDDDEEETKPHNPLLVVTNVMSREEIELKETVFRYVHFLGLSYLIFRSEDYWLEVRVVLLKL